MTKISNITHRQNANYYKNYEATHKNICFKCGGPCNRHYNSCKKCRTFRTPDYIKKYKRNYIFKRKYGIDIMEFETYWIAFKGKCNICKKDMGYNKKNTPNPLDLVMIDHNHTTGEFRGLLCSACNWAIGIFKDDVTILKKAIDYLDEEKQIN